MYSKYSKGIENGIVTLRGVDEEVNDDDWPRNHSSQCLCIGQGFPSKKEADVKCFLHADEFNKDLNDESEMRFTVQRYESAPPPKGDSSIDRPSSQSSSGSTGGGGGKDDESPSRNGGGVCRTRSVDSSSISQMGESLGPVFEGGGGDDDTHHSTIHEDDDDDKDSGRGGGGSGVGGGAGDGDGDSGGGNDDDESKPLKSSETDTEKIAQIGQSFHDRKTRRLVHKDGSCNVSSGNITKRKQKFLVDIFTTLVDMKWRYNLLLFAGAFVLSWIGFAIAWFVLAVAHGDDVNRDVDGWSPCVQNVHDFTTSVLFSVETQHTIGYGYRVIEPTCPAAVIILMMQSCIGVFIQSLMTGLIFAKLSRPKRRSQTMMFSRNAVISKQDGQYCLLFRVGDMRKSHFVGTSIRAILVGDKHTKEGETIPLCQFPLDLQTDTASIADNFVFLVWPTTVVHKITKSSPLWNVAADTLLKEQFEIIVILEGIVESTGMTTQVRTSYLPSEILWGHHLAPLMTYQKENGQYKIDYTQFQHAVPLNTMPSWSAKQHHERRGSDTVRETSAGDHSTSAYFTTVIRSNTSHQSVLKRMRSSIRRRIPSRDAPSRSSGSSSRTTAAGRKTNEPTDEQTKTVVAVDDKGNGSVSSLR